MASDLQRAKAGDRDALAKFVDENYDAVHRFCAVRLGPDLAPDAAQETFLTACRRLRDFRGESSLKTWLFGIAHNHCRNLARKRKMETLFWTYESTVENSPATGAQTAPDSVIDREALRTALRTLGAEHREVVLLKEVDGLTYDEVGVVLGIPSGTVKSRLHHAFRQLRDALLEKETDR